MTVTGLFNLMYVPGKLFVRGTPPRPRATSSPTSRSSGSTSSWDSSPSSASFSPPWLSTACSRGSTRGTRSSWWSSFIEVPQAFVSELTHLAALALVRGADFLSVFDKPQREALAMLCLHIDGQGTIISQMFWGLWLFPLGLLVWRSGPIPRILGGWLIVNGLGYLTNSFTGLLLPQHLAVVSKATFPFLLGEVAFMLWLLIMGARPRPLNAAAPSAAAG